MKGLDLLLEAWLRVAAEFPRWVLVVAGFDEDGYGSALLQRALRAGANDNVLFVGPVEGEAKEQLFASADLLVLPSRSENFGVVIGEALAREIPVITSKATPWSCIEESRCGWWIDVGVEPLVRALREALGTDVSELRARGTRGRRLVEKRFTVEASVRAFLHTYQWLLGERQQPDFVLRS